MKAYTLQHKIARIIAAIADRWKDENIPKKIKSWQFCNKLHLSKKPALKTDRMK